MSTYITKVTTTAGILQNAPVEFIEGLNCIIGARGTCKSTLIESIRFAFDLGDEKIALLRSDPAGRRGESQAGLIRSCLKSGTVRCEVLVEADGDKTSFSLEREVEGVPRTFKEGVLEYSRSEVLEMIEIYSQGDLQKIAENRNPSLRLELIDRPNKLQTKRRKQEQEERSFFSRLLLRAKVFLKRTYATSSALS